MAAKKTYGEIRLDPEKRQWVVTGTQPFVSLSIKDIFRRVSKTQTGEFRFPADDLHCYELLWFMMRYPLKMSTLDKARLNKGRKQFLADQEEVENLLSAEVSITQYPGLAEGCELWRYQQVAVEFFRKRRRMLLGDDIGLGKTNMAIGCMLVPGSLPCAVVCEAHVTQQWAKRIEEFSNLKVHVIKSVAPYSLPKADVYVFSYAKMVGWVDVVAHNASVPLFKTPIFHWQDTPEQRDEMLRQAVESYEKRVRKAGEVLPEGANAQEGFFKFLIWDEPQMLRGGYETDRGDAARTFVAAIPCILGLTATPVMNYGVEMFNVMEFIVPGVLGTKDEFIREWCDGNDKKVADPDALGSYLREIQVLLRRTEEEVGKELPQPNVQTHYCDYDDAVAAQNEDLAYTLAIKSQSGSFVERGSAYRQLDSLTRLSTGLAKAGAVAEYTKILLEADLPVLLSGWHREVYDVWLDRLKDWNPVMYTGSETVRAKERNKEAFMRGDSRLMIISNRSGAGLDGLQQYCADVVVGELDWSPMVVKQLIGRLRRQGQPFIVNAHYMIAKGGSDPLMVEVLGIKSSQAHGIMNPNAAPKAPINDEDRMRRLAEMVIARRKEREGLIAA
jgi:SNF2 family DNA or RNA helicase